MVNAARNLTGSTDFYQYDADGNLTADPYTGLTTSYNNLNKTDRITITSASGRYIAYTYGADGAVLRKRVYDNSALVSTTDYINGFVYENTALNYFSMPEGRVVSSGGTLQPEYVITDHQGNARFSFKDNGSGGMQILQENSYYAFGKTMPNSTVGLPTNPNNRLYNGGSEWQNTFSDLPDYYQTYYRNYDPAIGRFIGVDPMAETSDELTTYNYTGNNPVMFNDPLGDQKYTPDERITEVGLSFFKHGWFGYGQERWDALGVRSAEMMEQLQDLQYEPRVNADGSVTIYDSGDPNLSGPGAAAAANGLIRVWNPFGGNQISKQQWLDKGGNPDLIKAGQSPSYYGGAWKTVGNITFGSASQGGTGDPPLTHAQELAKYGQIVGFGNVSISGSYGAGVAYEYGTIETDKGWLQRYQTVYSVAGVGISGATTGGVIIAKGNNKPTFSDWEGLAMGGSVSYLFFGVAVATSTKYNVIGGSLGWGYGVKGNWNGTFAYAWTFLIGDPYPRPPVELTRSYINTQTYHGGQ